MVSVNRRKLSAENSRIATPGLVFHMIIFIIAGPRALMVSLTVVRFIRAMATAPKARKVAVGALDLAQFHIGLHLGTHAGESTAQVVDVSMLCLETLEVCVDPRMDMLYSHVHQVVQIGREVCDPGALRRIDPRVILAPAASKDGQSSFSIMDLARECGDMEDGVSIRHVNYLIGIHALRFD